MARSRYHLLCLAVVWGGPILPLLPTIKPLQQAELPAAVLKTLESRFPRAKVLSAREAKLDKPGSLSVYELRLDDNRMRKQARIAADGTLLQFSVELDWNVAPKQLRAALANDPGAASKPRIERLTVYCDAKEGALVKLPNPVTRYVVEKNDGDERTTTVLDSSGKPVGDKYPLDKQALRDFVSREQAELKSSLQRGLKIRVGMTVEEVKDLVANANKASEVQGESRGSLRFWDMNNRIPPPDGKSLTYQVSGGSGTRSGGWLDMAVEGGRIKNIYAIPGNWNVVLPAFLYEGSGEHIGLFAGASKFPW